jgi:hypothetical protein
MCDPCVLNVFESPVGFPMLVNVDIHPSEFVMQSAALGRQPVVFEVQM